MIFPFKGSVFLQALVSPCLGLAAATTNIAPAASSEPSFCSNPLLDSLATPPCQIVHCALALSVPSVFLILLSILLSTPTPPPADSISYRLESRFRHDFFCKPLWRQFGPAATITLGWKTVILTSIQKPHSEANLWHQPHAKREAKYKSLWRCDLVPTRAIELTRWTSASM